MSSTCMILVLQSERPNTDEPCNDPNQDQGPSLNYKSRANLSFKMLNGLRSSFPYSQVAACFGPQ